ncbi:hypothetical protein ACHAWF_016354 [Thalassiosira exigua]
MTFELNDVASSSSSSSSSSSPSRPRCLHEDDDEGDHEVDEALAYDLRSALHLAIGRICRAEDDAEREGRTTGPAFATSNEAISALTDLTYHYATSLLADDLVAFAEHAKRRTVKADDVLLAARKDRGMLAELKRVVADHPDVYAETKKTRAGGRSGRRGAASSKGKRTASTGENAGKKAGSATRGSATGGRQSNLSFSLSSSSSSDEDIDDDPLVMRRRKQQERRSLNKSRTSTDAGLGSKSEGVGVPNDEDKDAKSSGDDAFEFSATKSRKGANNAKSASPHRGPVPDRDLADSDESETDQHNQGNKGSLDSGSNDMVIDLCD